MKQNTHIEDLAKNINTDIPKMIEQTKDKIYSKFENLQNSIEADFKSVLQETAKIELNIKENDIGRLN